MRTLPSVLLLLLVAACDDLSTTADSGSPPGDGGPVGFDATLPANDAGLTFDASVPRDGATFDASFSDGSVVGDATLGDATLGDAQVASDGGPRGDGGVCGTTTGATGLMTLQVDGRSVTVYVPKTLAAGSSAPVILSMHGFGIDAAQMPNITGFPALADTEGLIAVFPTGNLGSWNTGKSSCGLGSLIGTDNDDITYLQHVLDAVAAVHCIDRTRVFATGFSMGGYSANYLACKRPDLFRAAAAHSGGAPTEACVDASIPVLVLHGTNDGTISYDCGTAAHDLWVKHNNCSTAAADVETVTVKGGECVYHRKCVSGTQVGLCSFKGMGHGWAGSTDLLSGGGDAYASATQLLWDFFKPYR